MKTKSASIFRYIVVPMFISVWIIAGASAGNARMDAVLKNGRFISYTPRSFSVVNGQTQPATLTGITEDLKLLRPDFDSLITYSCFNGLEHVPSVAEKLNYRAVIIGIWDPRSEIEIQNATRLSRKHPKTVFAIAIGNEGIFAGHYSPVDVENTIRHLRKEIPSVFLTTSEPFFLYLKPEYFDFFNKMDFLLPNIHPIFEKWFHPSDAPNGATYVLNVADKLQQQYPQPLIVKETGLPSGPVSKGYSEAFQSAFWTELLRRTGTSSSRAVSCFEAFDAPWKPIVTQGYFPGDDHVQEAYWGVYTFDGKPKPVVNAIRSLRRER
jgi:exo-beta-1,3-glucanase (GH17 family)